VGELKMSRPAEGKPAAQASTRSPAPAPRPPRTDIAARLGLIGSEGSRRRGAVLRRLLACGDWVALIGALCVATAATSTTDVAVLFWAVMFSPAWILVLKLHGLYDNDHRRIRHSTLDEISSLISASALGTLALDGLLALSPSGPLSPQSAIMVGIIACLGSFVIRGVLRFGWHRLTGTAAGIVIGPPTAVGVVARRIATHPEARLNLVGYLSMGSAEERATPDGLPWLGSVAEMSRIADENNVERVIVTEQQMSEPAAERLIEECKEIGLGLTFLPQHFGLLGPGIELNRLAELPVLDFRFADPPRSTLAAKRTVDVVLSALFLTLLSPLLIAIAIAILVDSGRPILFRQRRAGMDGAAFTMLKFRTMVNDAEERLGDLVDLGKLEQPAFKIANDPRVTGVGRGLRRFSLDEIPQFVNVLKGEMSLVGPRPEEEAVVALYNERQRARLAVKPGVTGPMQVYGRSELTFEERLAMERDYLDNLSVAGDMAILLRTPAAIVRGEGGS
jgi:exopolysaccharide biosynthesis polyprenyl glycosylphosphotransferase